MSRSIARAACRPAHGCSFVAAAAAAFLISTPLLAQEADPASTYPHVHHPDQTDGGKAFSLEIVYTSEVLGNVSGGLRQAARYLDNLDVIAQADLDLLVGWKGARVQLYGLYNNGVSFSPLVGDAQVISNIETGVRAVRLYEAWIEQDLGSRASLKVGLYDLNSEFDVLESAGLFVNSAHGIGSDLGLSGENGPSIFPTTSLAARFQITPADGWVIRAAVLDGVPNDPDRPARTVIRLSRADGALLVGEVEAPLAGGRLLFGHWRYTASFERLDGSVGTGNSGTYVRGEMPLFRKSADANQGIDAFFRFGTANGEINQFDRFLSGGITALGTFRGRDGDSAGLSFATAFASPTWRNVTDGGRAETVIEASYRAQLTGAFALQPMVQYIVSPSADPMIPNSLVLGVRAELSWGL